MLAKVFSATTIGLDGVLIEIEVDVAGKGFPTFTIVGLPDKAIDEAKDRVKTAINNAGCKMPDSRLTINMAPADIRKVGSGFDLPIAIGILTAMEKINFGSLQKSLFIGELSLEGRLRKVPGILPIVLLAKKKKIKNVFLPMENAYEAALVDGINIFPVFNLTDLIFHLNENILLKPQEPIDLNSLEKNPPIDFDFCEIKGQEQAKRALEIAAAGMHNLHLKGVPGAGKTMLCRAFPSILPPMEKDEILEVTKIYSILGLINEGFIVNRPFRSPHHTTSRIGLVGGSTNPAPGEISLSHRGVLFLDELPEFPRSVLESLRQPLEDGKVTISRASGSITFPSRFLLLTASNPCPCGYLGHPKRPCHCLPGAVIKYKKRLSGPLLDRIDLHIDVPPVKEEKLVSKIDAESSEKIRARVINARNSQKKRFASSKIKTNGEMATRDIKKFCQLTGAADDLLKQAISRLSLSARSYFKIIKISQTIADLNGDQKIQASYIAEALQYRVKEE